MDTPHEGSALAPRVEALRQILTQNHRFSKGLIERGYATFGSIWAQEFNRMLQSLFPDDESLSSAAKGYAAFAFDSMRHQKAFERDRSYPHKTYEEVANQVYFNEEHMEKEYLPGLLLSHYLWPHHYRQLQFFNNNFVLPLSMSDQKSFIEVGIGTTLYSRIVLENVPDSAGVGYDISPSSCRYAERHVKAISAECRYQVCEQDIVAQPIDQVPWIICVEVLEHLEDPVEFLVTLRKTLRRGGHAFITAAINSGHADHIYLYRSPQDVALHLNEAGFHIEQGFSDTAFPPPAPGVPVPEAAAFVVSSV